MRRAESKTADVYYDPEGPYNDLIGSNDSRSDSEWTSEKPQASGLQCDLTWGKVTPHYLHHLTAKVTLIKRLKENFDLGSTGWVYLGLTVGGGMG